MGVLRSCRHGRAPRSAPFQRPTGPFGTPGPQAAGAGTQQRGHGGFHPTPAAWAGNGLAGTRGQTLLSHAEMLS